MKQIKDAKILALLATSRKIRRAVLVYQGGLANVFAVDNFATDYYFRGKSKRLVQYDFQSCEAFARGLDAAGILVTTACCDQAGDIEKMTWEWKLDDAPFSDRFRPVYSKKGMRFMPGSFGKVFHHEHVKRELCALNVGRQAKLHGACILNEERNCLGTGWYWQSCFPGRVPDSDPYGPFNTYEAARTAAQADAQEDPRNEDRALWAELAIATFADAAGLSEDLETVPETVLTDLLADLMHWSDVQKSNPRSEEPIEFEAALERARNHYSEERGAGCGNDASRA